MLTIYRSDVTGAVNEIQEFTKGSWIHLVNPTKDEADQVIAATKIPEDFIYDPLDVEEKPRFEKDDEGLLMIVDVPYIEEESSGRRYNTIPLGIIVTSRHFITVCSQQLDVLTLFSNGKLRTFRTNYRSRFVFQILYKVSSSYLRFLRQIDRRMDELEDELQRSMRNQEIFQLMNLQKSLVYFMTSLKSNDGVLDRIIKTPSLEKHEDDEDLLEDVFVEHRQAMEMAQIYKDIISSTMDTFGSVISNNVNFVMKFLASITIVISIPTMISGMFGMNVHVPWEGEVIGFWIVFGMMIFFSGLAAFILWRRRFF
ncbi:MULTISPECIES: magnesium transporter CorA family protein [Exiguobacterium]|uniref:Magnesium transporter n=1 Tax=Exiguobacterium oxidotolerans TaxID=223958 RepID=A0A653IFJ5_9BACL|nr:MULTISPECIES: magnesium transporter CorA family protein [Exiguobacterium]ASI34936.1 magnesium transporter [Exiguobacterium sp. N4-1P]VWX37915.1 Magnesium transporter [Exiguobacterium oxidotolerans]